MSVVSTGLLTITDTYDGIAMTLSSYAFNVPTNDQGGAGVFTGCATTVKITNGATDLTSLYTITPVSSVGITGSYASNTYTVTAMTTDVGTVDFTATRAGFDTLTARFTVTKSKQGIAGLTIVVTNENHTLPASSAGVVSSYLGSGTNIQVFDGTTALTAISAIAANGQFTIGTPVISPAASITVGTRSYASTTATVAAHSAMASGTDLLTITYPISIRRLNGTNVTIDRVQTISKSKQNAPVARGTVHLYVASTSAAWVDSEADTALAAAPHNGKITADRVTLFNQTLKWSQTKAWSGSAWTTITEVVDGNLLVTRTIIGDKLAVNAVSTNIVNSNGIDVTNSNYKLTMLTTDRPIALTNAAGTEDFFIVNKDGTGFFKGGVGKDSVTLESINLAARRAINPYYLGAGEERTLATNTFVNTGTRASLTSMTSAAGDRISLNIRIAENQSEFGGTTQFTNSTWQVKLQKSVNGGAFTDLSGGTFNLTVTGYYIAPSQGEPADGGYAYDLTTGIIDVLTAAETNVVYSVLLTCTAAGVGTSTSLRVVSFKAEKSAIQKNLVTTNATVTRWTDKETGFTIITGQGTVGADTTLVVSFGFTLSSVISSMAQRVFGTYNDWAVGASAATTTQITIYNQYNAGLFNWVVYGFVAV